MPSDKRQLAKLTPPRLAQAVLRDRLFAQLDQARGSRSALCVIGPPGAGKTTLVASWLDARGIPGIWYQVDPGDSDLATFFYYLGEAARPFAPRGMRPLPALTPEYLADVAGFARRFFRAFFARLPEGAAVVLDNYQEVDAHERFHQLVANAVSEVPPSATLIVVSRRDPPDCYARFVANENVALVAWDALRLTLTEAQQIATARKRLDEEAVRRIHALTDGWAAGFTLMLERGPDAQALPKVPANARQALFDYFASETWSQVPPEVRRFLAATAVLPSVSVQVAQALTGNAHAQDILEDLYRRHLFVHRRDGVAPSYHYHALFRGFLVEQGLRSLVAGELESFRASAARLLEASDELEAAVELYCDASGWADAVRLTVACAPRLLAQGRWRTLQELAGRIPDGDARCEPWLGYWLARAVLGITPPDARTAFLQALRDFEAGGDVLGQIHCAAGVLETFWVESAGHETFDAWIDRLTALLEAKPRFPDTETELRVLSMLLMCMSLTHPHHTMIAPLRERLTSLVCGDASDSARLLAGTALFGLCLATGDLRLGRWIVGSVGALADSERVTGAERLMWLPRVACHHLRCGDDTRARAVFAQAQRLAEEEGLRVGWRMRCWWGAHIAMLVGDMGEASRFAELLGEELEGVPVFQRGLLHNTRCMIALASGQRRLALEEGRKAVQIARASGVSWASVWFALPVAVALLEEGAFEEAEAQLVAFEPLLEGTFLESMRIEPMLARAYAALLLGQPDQSRQRLAASLAAARAIDYCFPLRTAFLMHRRLLSEALERDVEPDYVRQTIRRFALRPGAGASDRWPWPVKVYTLGRFEVRVDERVLSFGRKQPRKPLALLKLLVAAGPEPVPEHVLVDALWPDEPGDAARRACEMAVHRLRTLLGAREFVQVSDGTVGLDLSRCWVDVFELQQLAAGAPGAQPDPAALAAAAERCTQLYVGAFLPAEADAVWALRARASLAARFAALVARAAAMFEQDGRIEDAITWYRRGIDAHPTSEHLYQGLMRCQLHAGRYAEGMDTFQRMRDQLSLGLGARPSAASEALLRALQSA